MTTAPSYLKCFLSTNPSTHASEPDAEDTRIKSLVGEKRKEVWTRRVNKKCTAGRLVWATIMIYTLWAMPWLGYLSSNILFLSRTSFLNKELNRAPGHKAWKQICSGWNGWGPPAPLPHPPAQLAPQACSSAAPWRAESLGLWDHREVGACRPPVRVFTEALFTMTNTGNNLKVHWQEKGQTGGDLCMCCD